MKITRDSVWEIEPGRFVASASDLQWAPGAWPKQVDADDLGNGQPFIRKQWLTEHGEITAATYWQAFGCADLIVFND